MKITMFVHPQKKGTVGGELKVKLMNSSSKNEENLVDWLFLLWLNGGKNKNIFVEISEKFESNGFDIINNRICSNYHPWGISF